MAANMAERAKFRNFKEALKNRGDAEKIRQSVSAAVRESAIQSRPKLVDPIDYETYVVQNKVLLHNDPQREMLNFPHDDVEVPAPSPSKRLRTVYSTVPKNAVKEAKSLMVKECIKTYTNKCHMIKFKYHNYSGSYQQLPRARKPLSLPEQVFEIDAEIEEKDDDTLSRSLSSTVTKKGWLFKGPDSGKDNIISFTRQFKKRYFVLKQQTDFTYILEYHKDDKMREAKGAVYLDLAKDVVKNPKKGKSSFEIRMSDGPSCLFAAENEADMEEWIQILNKVISAADTASQVSRDSIKEDAPAPGKPENYKESSMNHPVMKYSRETDSSLSKAREENRQNLFQVYPDMRKTNFDEEDPEDEDEIDVFPKQDAERFLLRLEEFKLDLQYNLAEEGLGNKVCNPEPFFISFALYDAKEGKKISEDFHVDPNEAEIKQMIPVEVLHASDKLHTVEGKETSPDLNGLKDEWIRSSKRQGLFTVIRRHSEIYLVAKIEKVLQGGVSQCVEPYVKVPDPRVASKVHRQMKQLCHHIGHYRMPFAWSARPLGATTYGKTDLKIYRQETSKMSEDEVVKLLQDMKKPEKQSRLQTIHGILRIWFEHIPCNQDINNVLTPSLVPVLPFPNPPTSLPTVEVEEFVPDKAPLYTSYDYYLNHLYVYPMTLKYDSQKSFTRARNIACSFEVRDSDDEGAVPLKCIYGRPHAAVFTTEATTAVLHHSTTPEFTEEIKIALPVQLHEKHHLLVRLYHVSCEASKTGAKTSSSSLKSKNNIEIPVGFAWLPLLSEGRISVGERTIRVATNLPPGYLHSEALGLGRGSSGPDIKWVEGGRPLFKMNLRLMSTIYTQDQFLHNFFQQCQKMESDSSLAVDMNSINKLKNESDTEDSENSDDSVDWLSNLIKSLLAVEVSVYIQFLPTLFNQLFHLLARTANEDVAINAVRVLIHVVHEVYGNNKEELLQKYVKYVFRPDPVQKGSKQKTVHEELAKNLNSMLRPANADQLVIRKFLEHSWFIFDILVKSMTQYLIDTDRVKMPRNERFSSDYQYRVQNLLQIVVTLVSQRHQEEGTQSANRSLAFFVKDCFTLMDRGFVFKLVAKYIETFNVANNKILHQMKFEFLRIVCSHEHYIPMCLPLMRKGRVKNFKDLRQDYTLSEEYRRTHYLVGLLIHELKLSLTQPRDMRRPAITVLRNQLAKHAFDDRYNSKSQQGRIAALYLPLISVLLENKARLMKDVQSPATSSSNNNAKTQVANGDAGGAKSNSQTKQPAPPPPVPVEQRPSSKVFDMIGMPGVTQYGMTDLNGRLSRAIDGSSTSLNSDESSSTEKGDSKDKDVKGHARRESTATLTAIPQSPYVNRYDRLDVSEVRDLLLCYLYVVKFLPEDILLGWFNNSSENDIADFFSLLGVCLDQFKYKGRKRIVTLSIIGDPTANRALSLPSRISMHTSQTSSLSSGRSSMYSDAEGGFHTPTSSDADAMMRALKEGNMTTEVGMVLLDILGLFCQYFKKDMEARDGENALMKSVFRLYLTFLRSSQSETLQKHVFASLRGFIKKFQLALFKGSASLCGELCYEILRCCSSKLNSTRREACALLYLLMRTNFEFSNKKSFTRVHLQVIISVSQLIGDVMLMSTTRFQESLAIVNNYANTDRGIQKTPFPGEVKDLTKRIRTVLMATAQMKENQNDPELLVDLQYSLAKSYASTPELRKTWLDSMAKLHIKNGDFSEAAHCYIHIAALIAEYLKKRGLYPQGCTAFSRISPNIAAAESGIKDDSGMEDVQYTEDTLVEFLEQAARMFEKAERYELLGEVYKLIIPMYEKSRNFQKLQQSYDVLSQAYSKVIEVMYSGRRLLGTYFRVAFFGQTYFEDDDGKEYIYKEPKVTNLSDIHDRLQNLYSEKFGKEFVKLIKSDNKVNPAELDSRYAHIQVTYVTPYFEEKELADRLTDYERNNNIRRFMFETPFTKDGKSHGSIDEQCKRRTVLITTHTFPYVKKRIEVRDRKETVLHPVEVAVDQMQSKVAEMKEVLNSPAPDLIKLQLKLQGSVNPQVHAGPLVYAEAFLQPAKVGKYKAEMVEALKTVFREFVSTCKDALELNAQLITTDQKEYHESLKAGFLDIVDKLGVMLGEKISTADIRNSYARLSLTLNPTAPGSSNA